MPGKQYRAQHVPPTGANDQRSRDDFTRGPAALVRRGVDMDAAISPGQS